MNTAIATALLQSPPGGANDGPQPIPGLLQYVQTGYNPKTGTVIGNPIFQVTFDQGKTVLYGQPGQQTVHSVPDQVNYQEDSHFENESILTIMKTQEQYDEAFSVSMSGDYSGVAWSGSASGSLAYTGSLFRSSDKEYYLNFSVQKVYNVQRSGNTGLTAPFAAAIAALPGTVNAANYPQFKAFFDTYGTHYLQSGSFGGFMVLESDMDTSLVESQSSLTVTAAIDAAYDGAVSSGSVSVSTMIKNSAFLSQYQSQISLKTSAIGGLYSDNVATYVASCFSLPALLLGPAATASLIPAMTPLATLAASPARQQSMMDAMDHYLELPCIGLPSAIPYGQSEQMEVDGFILGFMNCGNGGRGTITGTSNGTALGLASAHLYLESDRWAGLSAFSMPCAQGAQALAVASTSSNPAPAYSLYQCLLGPTRDAPFFGPLAPQTNTSSSGTAQTDGFMVVTVAKKDNGDRGWATLTIGGTVRGACSMHYYQNSDTWYPQDSFCVPVRKGETWTTNTTATSGQPQFTVSWMPLNELVLQAKDMRTANTVYKARTDGFLVAVLQAANGGRATVKLQCAASAAQFATMPVLVGTAVHHYEEGDTYLPCNTAMLPVQRGQAYQALVNVTSPGVIQSVYWIAVTNPLYDMLN